MSELRWNPLLRTWTMVASNRKARPRIGAHSAQVLTKKSQQIMMC